MRSPSSVRPHKAPAQRADILAAYQHTTLSSHQFARRHGIAASTLYRWLQRSWVGKGSGPAALIEVPNLLGSHSAVPAYRLRFANGVSVEVASGFKADEVRTLAEVVHRL